MDRTLTAEAEVAYAARLGAVGATFAAQGDPSEPIGFRVNQDGAQYDYRYAEGETAVDLMERICTERGA